MKKEDICYVIATCRRAESSIFASFIGKCMTAKMYDPLEYFNCLICNQYNIDISW